MPQLAPDSALSLPHRSATGGSCHLLESQGLCAQIVFQCAIFGGARAVMAPRGMVKKQVAKSQPAPPTRRFRSKTQMKGEAAPEEGEQQVDLVVPIASSCQAGRHILSFGQAPGACAKYCIVLWARRSSLMTKE